MAFLQQAADARHAETEYHKKDWSFFFWQGFSTLILAEKHTL